MNTQDNALFASLRSSIDALRFHTRITAVWIAALIITITILTVVAVLPGVLDSTSRSHSTTIDDLNAVAR